MYTFPKNTHVLHITKNQHKISPVLHARYNTLHDSLTRYKTVGCIYLNIHARCACILHCVILVYVQSAVMIFVIRGGLHNIVMPKPNGCY